MPGDNGLTAWGHTMPNEVMSRPPPLSLLLLANKRVRGNHHHHFIASNFYQIKAIHDKIKLYLHVHLYPII